MTDQSPRTDVSKVVAKAWTDEEFKSKLLENPHEALADAGIPIAEGVTVEIHQESNDVTHVILPPAPEKAGEMSIEELESIAGGYAGRSWG